MATPVVCFGDSITSSFNFPELIRWPSQLQILLNTAFPEQYEVYNRGVGGNTVPEGIARFEGQVAPLLPGIVLIEFGFNDASVAEPLFIARNIPAAFEAHLTEVIRLIRDKKGLPILIVNHPILQNGNVLQYNGKPYTENYEGYTDIVRKVARDTQTLSIDLERSMLEAHVSLPEILDQDGLHLTRVGNTVYAEHVWRGLQPILLENQILEAS